MLSLQRCYILFVQMLVHNADWQWNEWKEWNTGCVTLRCQRHFLLQCTVPIHVVTAYNRDVCWPYLIHCMCMCRGLQWKECNTHRSWDVCVYVMSLVVRCLWLEDCYAAKSAECTTRTIWSVWMDIRLSSDVSNHESLWPNCAFKMNEFLSSTKTNILSPVASGTSSVAELWEKAVANYLCNSAAAPFHYCDNSKADIVLYYLGSGKGIVTWSCGVCEQIVSIDRLFKMEDGNRVVVEPLFYTLFFYVLLCFTQMCTEALPLFLHWVRRCWWRRWWYSAEHSSGFWFNFGFEQRCLLNFSRNK